jgi:hypothetical protein
MVSHGGQWSMMSPPAWPVDERVVWEPCVLIACLRKTGRLAVWRFCGGEDARIWGWVFDGCFSLLSCSCASVRRFLVWRRYPISVFLHVREKEMATTHIDDKRPICS